MLELVLRRARHIAVSCMALGALAAVGTTSATAAPRPDDTPWLYKGSDVPVDREWTFGTLPNGLRYAVRHNVVPQHQVAVRVVIDTGSLMERKNERGYAHFIEHLSFRGSKYAGDGEAKRVWQRLGTTFGSDTNAQTSYTQTVYKLDLPNATTEGLEESLRLLSGMMSAPSLTASEVDAERRTVLAEARESASVDERIGEVSRQLFFAGQLLADRAPIGTDSSLAHATPEKLRAFHDRWYRPNRTVIVIAGDGSPAIFADLIARYFGDWRAAGRTPSEPDFGVPDPKARTTATFFDPALPMGITLAYLRPWVPHDDTIAYNRGKLVETIALKILNRRLEARARKGESFLSAGAGQNDTSRSVDETAIQVTPIGEDWARALRDVRAMIAEMATTKPTQAEVDQEVRDFVSDLDASVEQSRADSGSKLADLIVDAVDARETVASPVVARDVFGAMQGQISPDAILAAAKHLFSGVGPRVLLSGRTAIAHADNALRDVLDAPVVATSTARLAPAGFDKFPRLGTPSRITATHKIGFDTVKIVEFANGVKLIVYALPGTSGRVFVAARFGHGRQDLPADKPTLAWAGPRALVASGMGGLDQDGLDQLMIGRRLGLEFDLADDAFVLRSRTNATDLADELKLMAEKLAFPGWDAAPIARVRAVVQTELAAQEASPQSIITRDLRSLLHGGDPRWKTPDASDVNALTPESFRALWAPLLKAGPIEVEVFGDVNEADAIASVAATFGALAPRKPLPIAPNSAHAAGLNLDQPRLVRYHDGDADQAGAVLAWPTAGGIDQVLESRKLDVLAQIFSDRMFERLREGEGAAYSPTVFSDWSPVFTSPGGFVVIAQVKPKDIDRVFSLSREIAADLAAHPVSTDEFERAIGPMRALISRAVASDLYWMSELAGATNEPKRIDNALSIGTDLRRITPELIQATAKAYLVPQRSVELVVLPHKK